MTITSMWAALKQLLQQEGSCAPSSRAAHAQRGDSQCKAKPAAETADFKDSPRDQKGSKSHKKKKRDFERKRDSSTSQLSNTLNCKGSVEVWEHSKENGPNPNLPLPHVSSPAFSPCKDDDRAPRIEAQAWRIRAAQPKALSVWEVRRLMFYEPGKETCANNGLERMHCSASASDAVWGQLPGWEVTNALGGVHTAGHGWGGRPDDNWEIWVGAEWGTPLQIERVKILQGESRGHSFRSRNRGPTTAQSIFIEAQLEDRSWGLVAGPVPINTDGWTTIRLCCAGAKRRRANLIQNSVSTPALRIASPNEAVPKVSEKECASPSSASTAPSTASGSAASGSTSSKKVTFAENCTPQAFPSLGKF